MTVLYVKEPGSVIRREVERIKVTRRPRDKRVDELLHSISVRDLEQVVIYGNVQLTTQAAALLLENEIDVVFLSHYGKFRGRLGQDGSKFARLRHAQLRLAGDDARSLGLALAITAAKLANQRGVLARLGATGAPEVRQALQQAAGGIEQMRGASRQARTLDALRGFEGKGGVYYFGALKRVLAPRWAFTGRQYHPAPDPFNALLSFGYALLQKDMSATIHLVGLDPYVGCFHALEYGRPSLTLDLMEEFRHQADRLALTLVNRGQVSADDFMLHEGGGVTLDEQGRKAVVVAWQERKQEELSHPLLEEPVALGLLPQLQARLLARTLRGDMEEYLPFLLR